MRKIVEDILQWKKKNDPDFVNSKDSTYINSPVRFSDDGKKVFNVVKLGKSNQPQLLGKLAGEEILKKSKNNFVKKR